MAFGSKPLGREVGSRSPPRRVQREMAHVKRNKAKRKLQVQAEAAAERDASAPGKAVLERLTDAVKQPTAPAPRP